MKSLSNGQSDSRLGAISLLIAFLQAPVGDFDAPGEPDFYKALGVVDKLVNYFGAKWHTGYERMQVEGEKLRRALFAFPIKIVKLIFHDLQQIARCSAGAVSRVVITAGNVVRNHDDLSAVRLYRVRVVRVERIGPPD